MICRVCSGRKHRQGVRCPSCAGHGTIHGLAPADLAPHRKRWIASVVEAALKLLFGPAVVQSGREPGPSYRPVIEPVEPGDWQEEWVVEGGEA